MPQLRVKTGPNKGKVHELTRDVVQLGREAEVQVPDASASRHHAEVFAIGDMYFLRDLGSRNGTFLNEQRVEPDDQALLREGDLIRISNTQLVFEETAARRPEKPEFSSREEDFSDSIELDLEAETAAEEAPETTVEADIHFPVLFSLARACSSAFAVKALMDRICAITLEAVPAEEVYFFVREGGRLEPVAHKRRGKKSELKISATIAKRSLQHNRAILVSDAQSDKRFSASKSVIMQGIRSVICAPLAAHERVSGVLYCHSASVQGAFTDDHLRLVTAIALQAAVGIEAIAAREESRQQLLSVFRTILTAHEQASPTEPEGHSQRVHTAARAICKALELPPAEARTIELAALLHEIGKIGAPEGAFEREESRTHYALLGAQMLRKIDGLEDAAQAVEAHLERLDGTGGPKGLIGHQIPRSARIVGLADAFDRRLTAAGEKAEPAQAVKETLMGLNEVVKEKFDPEAFRGLARALRTGALKLS
ncbi:MAG: HD domain-containing phosphohydrolase [Candidatus Brocadiia bacterium]